MDKIFKEFDMSEKEYHHARYNLTTPSYVISQDIHEDSLECKVLYFDSDDGVALIRHFCEVFDSDGFNITLIDCNYCDIGYDDMLDIIQLFKDFDEATEEEMELVWTEHYTKN